MRAVAEPLLKKRASSLAGALVRKIGDEISLVIDAAAKDSVRRIGSALAGQGVWHLSAICLYVRCPPASHHVPHPAEHPAPRRARPLRSMR